MKNDYGEMNIFVSGFSFGSGLFCIPNNPIGAFLMTIFGIINLALGVYLFAMKVRR